MLSFSKIGLRIGLNNNIYESLPIKSATILLINHPNFKELPALFKQKIIQTLSNNDDCRNPKIRSCIWFCNYNLAEKLIKWSKFFTRFRP